MTSYITVKNLKKEFKVPIRKSGLKEALKSFIKRDYKVIHAIDDISFSINKGEIVGYIGPNGAGKSTTIKILTGILVPTAGSCTIGGITPGKPTAEYLTRILNYIIFIGAIGLTIISVIPIFFSGVFNADVSFGGTSIIIIVGVILETIRQIEALMVVRKPSRIF